MKVAWSLGFLGWNCECGAWNHIYAEKCGGCGKAKIVLKCPVCGKGYKTQRAMLAHFSRVHDAITHEKQVELYHKAIDNWNKETQLREEAEQF